MRRCLIGDIMALASAIAPADAHKMQIEAARLIAEADAAHRYAKRHGRPHGRWGNGSLMARAMAEPVAQSPNFSCPQYLVAFKVVAAVLHDFRAHARGLGL